MGDLRTSWGLVLGGASWEVGGDDRSVVCDDGTVVGWVVVGVVVGVVVVGVLTSAIKRCVVQIFPLLP